MSSYFRMVNSSPPPLDDGPSFEDDDADEFGTFASVGPPVVDEHPSPEHQANAMMVTGGSNRLLFPTDTADCVTGSSSQRESNLEANSTTHDFAGADDCGVHTNLDCSPQFPTNVTPDHGIRAPSPYLDGDRTITPEITTSDGYWKECGSGSDRGSFECGRDESDGESAVGEEIASGSRTDLQESVPTVESPSQIFRTAMVADSGASQDSVSDSGLCTASQFSDGTFVDTSPDGHASGYSEVSPVTVGSNDDDGHVVGMDDEAFCTPAGSDATPDDVSDDRTPENRIQGDGTSQDGDASSGLVREVGDGEDDDDFSDFAGFEPAERVFDSIKPVRLKIDGWPTHRPSDELPNVEIAPQSADDRPSTMDRTPGDDFEEFSEFQDADYDPDFGRFQDSEKVGNQIEQEKAPEVAAFASDAEIPSVDDQNFAEFGNFATFDEFRFQMPDESQPFRAVFTDGDQVDNFHQEEDDEFGNFDSAKPTNVGESNPILKAVGETLSLTFPRAPTVDGQPAVVVPKLDDALDCMPPDDDATSTNKKGIWSQLFDIDSTHALTYRWSQSQSSQKLMESLHIDSRNLLLGTKWNSSIPLFAATMSLNPLEPTKAVAKPSEEDQGMSSATAADKLSNGNCIPENVIPPASFDWSSSGLVNPLDGLETELLGTDGGGKNVAATCSQQPSPLLEKILKQVAVSSSATYAQARKRMPNLSNEAQRILDSLPDLSFMQAKVLMFPIRSAVP